MEKEDREKAPNGALKVSVVIMTVVCVAALAGWYWLFGSGGREVVDFGRTVRTVQTAGESKPELRVAIAAMVSPEATRRYYYDMVELLGDNLDIRTVFLQRRTYAEVNRLVKERMVDVAFVCAGPYVEGHDDFGMEIVAVPVVGGEKVYHSYILAAAGSDVASFEDLRGRRFAFTDPDSNTGCLVPRYMLAKAGESPETYFSETFFTHSHDNSIQAVAEGQADGAAVDSLIYDFLKAREPRLTAGTKVVEESPPYGIPPIVVHPELDPSLKARIKDAFFKLHESEKGRAILDNLQIERFESGSDRDYDEVRSMQGWLEESVEGGNGS